MNLSGLFKSLGCYILIYGVLYEYPGYCNINVLGYYMIFGVHGYDWGWGMRIE